MGSDISSFPLSALQKIENPTMLSRFSLFALGSRLSSSSLFSLGFSSSLHFDFDFSFPRLPPENQETPARYPLHSPTIHHTPTPGARPPQRVRPLLPGTQFQRSADCSAGALHKRSLQASRRPPGAAASGHWLPARGAGTTTQPWLCLGWSDTPLFNTFICLSCWAFLCDIRYSTFNCLLHGTLLVLHSSALFYEYSLLEVKNSIRYGFGASAFLRYGLEFSLASLLRYDTTPIRYDTFTILRSYDFSPRVSVRKAGLQRYTSRP
ncbi:hypothetical protein C8Q77DRAFT_695602 [Trametes polyzona]|nr:hypothetical protein C8Q77DRAFT_695602 [Trametes polyzona]